MYLEPSKRARLLSHMKQEIEDDLQGTFRVLEEKLPEFKALLVDQRFELFRAALRDVVKTFPETSCTKIPAASS